MVLLPEPFGPSRPKTSRSRTSKETASTANRAPKRLLSRSSERTAIFSSGTRHGGEAEISLAVHQSREPGCCRSVVELRRLLHGLEGIRIVSGEEIRLLVRHRHADPFEGGEETLRVVGQHDVRRNALFHVLAHVDIVAGQDDET